MFKSTELRKHFDALADGLKLGRQACLAAELCGAIGMVLSERHQQSDQLSHRPGGWASPFTAKGCGSETERSGVNVTSIACYGGREGRL